MKPETQTNLDALRHAVMVGAQLLDEDMASELCGRIEAVVEVRPNLPMVMVIFSYKLRIIF